MGPRALRACGAVAVRGNMLEESGRIQWVLRATSLPQTLATQASEHCARTAVRGQWGCVPTLAVPGTPFLRLAQVRPQTAFSQLGSSGPHRHRANLDRRFSGSFPHAIDRATPPARRRSRCGEGPDFLTLGTYPKWVPD